MCSALLTSAATIREDSSPGEVRVIKALGEGAIQSVLVVDDDEGLWRSAARQLRPRRVSSAARIADAMRLAEAEAFDLAVIDVHLCDVRTGGENGLELVAQLHARDQSLPIVVITGWHSGHTVDAAYQAGAVKTYEKPFEWSDIIRDMEVGEAPASPNSIEIPTQQEWKREYVKRLLHETRYNVTKAAKTMGVKRTSLQRLLANYGFQRKKRRA